MPVRDLFAQHKPYQKAIHFDWFELAALPPLDGAPNRGLAGAFSGISHDVLLVAGGANFPQAPAREGGTKKYWNDVYALQLNNGEKPSWVKKALHYPFPVAYGASLTLQQGILCIGGMNSGGVMTDVMLMEWNRAEENIRVSRLASLPRPLASLMVAHIGNSVYVAGGDDAGKTQKDFYRLDLDHPAGGWEQLPVWPGPPLADGVLVAQSNGKHECLYLIGGRTSSPGKLSACYNSVYVFDPSVAKWKKQIGIRNLDGSPAPLFAGTGIAEGKDHIILFGGNDGKLFTEIEKCNLGFAAAKDEQGKAYWQQRKDSVFTHHPGFNRTIYLYNTVSRSWGTAGELAYPAQLTTAVFFYGAHIMIPCGEVRPGIRTADIICGRLDYQ